MNGAGARRRRLGERHDGAPGGGLRSGLRRFPRALTPANISIVYIYLIGFVIFSAVIPNLWLDGVTQQSILNISVAVPGMVALAVTLPLLAGTFDLSVGGAMSASAITTSVLVVNHHWPVWVGILAGVAAAAIGGLVNGLLVVTIGVNSFIATLGTGAVLDAYAQFASGGVQITGFSKGFVKIASLQVVGITQLQVVYLLVIALGMWYVVEHLPVGRYLQATGDNPVAARLVGVRTGRYVFASLLVSAVIAGFAGTVETATIAGGSPTIGDAYLIPAFAAAFLGSTQFKGRVNVWGTVVAIAVLASGVQGVTLATRSYPWLNNLFFGLALMVAVGSSRILGKRQESSAWRQRRRQLADGLASVVPLEVEPGTAVEPRPVGTSGG